MIHALRVAFRINLLCVVVLLLLYGLLFESHNVLPLNGGTAVQIGGANFIEGSTWEQFALHEDTLVTAAAPVGAQAKDCKT
jgi:hypothetical protein